MNTERMMNWGRRLFFVFVVSYLSLCDEASAQKNIDTPNLDFSQGEAGWTYQTGWYTTPLMGGANEYTYIWDHTAKGTTAAISETDITHSGGRSLSSKQKSRFWRYATPEKDSIFSFLPLYVMPSENQGGVMRIGRPDPWIPKDGMGGKYTIKLSMGGDQTVDSDGNPFYFPLIQTKRSGVNCYDAGAENYGVDPELKRKGDEWHNPYYQGPTGLVNPWAGAERMYYDFKVTENSTLLIYRFLAIVQSPESAFNHSENGYAEMSINVLVKDDLTGKWSVIPSNEHHVVASATNSSLNYPGMRPMYENLNENPTTSVAFMTEGAGEGLDKNLYISEFCNSSKNHASHYYGAQAGGNLTNCFINYATIVSDQNKFYSRFHYSGWRTRYTDLRKYIGKTIRLEVLNHDCLMNNSNQYAVVAGGHSSYGYFQAETRAMDLKTDEKENRDKIELVAPEGFAASAYSWYRKSGGTITQDENRPNVAYVERESLIEGESCSCRINMDPEDTRGLSEFELSTSFSSVPVISHEQQSNLDTPNLDFSQGEKGWTFQTGWYTTPLKGSPDSRTYVWEQTSKGSLSSIKDADISHNNGLMISPLEKSRFWRFSNPHEKDRIFSYIPLYVMPNENQAGVMRIGRPDIWKPSSGIGSKYTMKTVMGGPNMVDSKGAPFSMFQMEGIKRNLYCFETGCEAYGMVDMEKTASEWSYPYCDQNDKTKMPWAGAERMYYDFDVTDNSTLLIYRFLTIFSSPESCKNHSENGCPGMTIYVLVQNEQTGQWDTVRCNDNYVINSLDPASRYPGITPMFGQLNEEDVPFVTPGVGEGLNRDVYVSDNCNASTEHSGHNASSQDCFLNYATIDRTSDGKLYSRYAQTGWKTRCADLSDYVGKRVRIEVLNHDCLMNDANDHSVVAGGHSSYGYFQAETRKKEIRALLCSEKNDAFVTLEAPKGFPASSYRWMRASGDSIMMDSLSPYIAYVKRSTLQEGERISCELDLDSTDTSGCDILELTAPVLPILVRPDASLTWACGGLASFQNESKVMTGEDEIAAYYWEFPDGSTSMEKDVEFQFEKPNTKYVVRLTAYTSWGCDFTKEIEVTTPAFPKEGLEKVVDTTYVCKNDYFSLDLSKSLDDCEGSTYTWFVDGEEDSSWPNNLCSYSGKNDGESHYYEVRIQNGPCLYEHGFLVNLLESFKLVVDGPSLACQGEEVTFSGSIEGAGSNLLGKEYRWRCSGPDGFESYANTSTFVVTAPVPGSYAYGLYVSPVDQADEGCRDSLFFSVNVREAPDVALEGNSDICQGSVFTVSSLSNSSLAQYQWWVNEAPIAENSQIYTNDNLSVGPNTIRVEVADDAGCKSASEMTVTVHPLPALKVDSVVGTPCENQSVELNLSGADLFSLGAEDSKGKFILKESKQGVYQYNITGVDSLGCVGTLLTSVEFYGLPDVHIDEENSISTVGRGMQALITATSENEDDIKEWMWTPTLDKGKRITPVLDTTTKFEVSVVDANGCVNSTDYTVTVVDNSQFKILGVTSVCLGAEVSLTADDETLSYTWHWKDGEAGKDTVATGLSFSFMPTASSVVFVTAKAAGSSADLARVVVPITVKEAPQIVIKGSSKLCAGEMLNLTAQSEEDYQYVWTDGLSGKSVTFIPLAGMHLYSVTGTNSANGCTSEASFVVETVELPVLNVTAPVEVCEKDSICLAVESATCIRYMWTAENESVVLSDSSKLCKRIHSTSAYKVKGIDENGCSTEMVHSIVVRKLPELKVDGNSEVCEGGSVTFTASSPTVTRWSWSTGETTSQITLNDITEERTLRVWGFDGSCLADEEIQIKLKRPELSVKEGTIVCMGGDLQLHAQGADKLTWESNGTEGAELNLQAVTASRVERLYGVDKDGCSATKEVEITVRSLPSVRLSGPSDACMNSEITLTGRGASRYALINENDLTDTLFSMTDAIKLQFTSTTSYRLLGWDEYGCKNVSSRKTIYARSVPDISLKGDSSICVGESLSLSAVSSMLETEWRWSDGGTTSRFSATPDSSFVLTVWATGNRCTTEKSVNITVHQLPELKVEGETSICEGDVLRLQATGADSYLWNGVARGANWVEENPTTTAYELTGTDANNCTNTISVPVVVNALPTLSLEVPSLACEDDSVRLTAISETCKNYQWKEGVAAGIYCDVRVAKEAVYTVVGFDENGCGKEVSTTLNVVSKPTLTVEGNTNVCSGETLSLSVSSPTATSWRWSTGDTASAISVDSITTDQNIWVSGTYSVADLSCSASLEIPIKVKPMPILSVREVPAVCKGGNLTLHAQGAETLVWQTNGREDYELALENVTEARVERLTGYDEDGCKATLDLPIEVRPAPVITLIAPVSACEEDTVTLEADGAIRYEWQDDLSTDRVREKQVFYSTTCTIYGWDEYGCRGEASAFIEVNPTPEIYLSANSVEVCKGAEATVTALATVADATWLWSDGSTSSTFSYTPTEDYVAKVRASYRGCSSEKALNIKVLPAPSLEVVGNTSLCVGGVLNLKASGAASYTWRDSKEALCGQKSELVVSDPVSTSYKLLGVNEYGCQDSMIIPIAVDESFTIEISGPAVACEGDTVRLSVKSDACDSFVWEDGYTSNYRDVVVSETQSYKVTGVSAEGCRASATKEVRVIPLPKLEVQGERNVCFGSSLSLSAVSSTANRWSWSTGNTTSTITLDSVVNDQKLWVYGFAEEDGLVCSNVEFVEIKVDTLPLLSILEEPVVCAGEDLILHAQGAESLAWETNASWNDVLELKSVKADRVEKLKGVNSKGCESVVEIPITVRPLPEVKLNGPDAVCQNAKVTLFAEGALQYEWESSDSHLDSIDVIVDKTTTYTLYGQNEFGCVGKATKVVKTSVPPEITITGDSVVCSGKKVTLTAKSNQSSTTWKWSDGSTSSQISMTPDSSLALSLQATSAGCSAEKLVNIVVNKLPELSVEGKTTLCKNEKLKLTATGATSYYWGKLSDGNTEAYYEDAKPKAKTYTLTGTDSNGCVSKLNIPVDFYAVPDLAIEAPDTVCKGDSVRLYAKSESCVSYLWKDSTELDYKDLLVNAKTSYTLTGYDLHGCPAKASKTISLYAAPKPQIIGEKSVCKGTTMHLQATGAVSYIWADSTMSEYNDVKIDAKQTIKVTGIDEHGCKGVGSLTVSVLSTPVISISGDTVLCAGETLSLSASSNLSSTSWIWSNGSTKSKMSMLPTSDTVVSVLATRGTCSSRRDIEVKVNKLPELAFEGKTKVCVGDSISLLGLGAKEYYWDNTLVNPYVAKLNSSKKINLEGVDSNGCKSRMEVLVETQNLPDVKIDGYSSTCLGVQSYLTAHSDGAVSYIWNDDESAVGDSLLVGASETRTYWVKAVGGGDLQCVGVDSLTVEVIDSPKLAIEGITEVCDGDKVFLTARILEDTLSYGKCDYLWSVGDDNQEASVAFVPTLPETEVSVEVRTANGCVARTETSVVRKELPKFYLEGKTIVCLGDSLRLSAVPEQSDAHYEYSWGTEKGSSFVCQMPTLGVFDIFVVALSEEGCSSIPQEVVVSVVPVPTFSIVGDTIVCKGSPAVLSAVSDQYSNNADFAWNYELLGAKMVSADSALTIPAVAVPMDVLLKTTVDGECASTTSVRVVPMENPRLEITGDGAPICSGREFSLTATNKLDDANETQYVWTNEEDTVVGPSYQKAHSQSLLLHLTGTKGDCSSTIDTFLTVHEIPEIAFEGDTALCAGDSLTLRAKGLTENAGLNFSWTHTDSLPLAGDTLSLSLAVGKYQFGLSAVDAYGCLSSELLVPVSVKERPTVSINPSEEGFVEVCRGLPLKLEAVGNQEGLSYKWSESGNTNELTIPSVTEEREYVVKVFDGSCYGYDTVTVRPKEAPLISLPTQTVCRGDSFVVRPDSNPEVLDYTFKYGPDEAKNVQEYRLAPQFAMTTLYVYARGVNGCSSTIPTEVKIKALVKPVIAIEGSTEICQNSILKLVPSQSDSLAETIFSWSDEQGKQYAGSLMTQLNELGDFHYTLHVEVKDSMSCQVDTTIKVTVHETPSLEVEGAGELCLGSDAHLKVVDPTENVVYSWYAQHPRANEEFEPLKVDSQYVVLNVQDTITLYLEGDNGYCKQYSSHKLLPVVKPDLVYTGATDVCEGSATTLVADSRGTGVLYSWNDQDPSAYAIYTTDMMYLGDTDTVKLTAYKGGCSDEKLIPIVAAPLPKATVLAKEVYSGEEFVLNYELEDNGALIVSEKWYSDEGLLGGKYAESLGGRIENHPWSTSYTTSTDDIYKMQLELVTDKGCTQQLPIEVPVVAKVSPGRYLVFNVLGQVMGVFDLDDETPLVDQLSFYRGFEILYLQSLDGDSTLLKVRVYKK